MADVLTDRGGEEPWGLPHPRHHGSQLGSAPAAAAAAAAATELEAAVHARGLTEQAVEQGRLARRHLALVGDGVRVRVGARVRLGGRVRVRVSES